MATDVYYNGVKLKNVTTRECDQQLVYDPSGADLLGERVSLSFEVIVHAQNLATLFEHGAVVGTTGAGQAADPTTQFHLIRARLSEPRASLVVTVNDVPLWTVYPMASTSFLPNALADVDNGPKPRNVRIVAIMGNKAYRISWSVDFMWGQCPTTGTAGNIVLSNKWSTSETVDANFYTTRTISGSIRFSSRLFAAHSYRPWCVPGLEYGFRRESINYESDPSGLEARYAITDRQVHTAAPWPATGLNGSYTWSTNLESGTWVHHADFTLTGAPDSDVGLLVSRAIELCDARVKYLDGPENPASKILNEASITENVGDGNSVRVTMTVTMYPDNAQTLLLANIAKDQIGKRIELQQLPTHFGSSPTDAQPYDPGRSRVPATYGYNPRKANARDPAHLFLLHAYAQTPCQAIKSMYQFGNATTSGAVSVETQYGAAVMELPSGSLPSGNKAKYKTGEMVSIYTYLRLSSEYRQRRGRAHLSIADDDAEDPKSAVIRFGRGLSQRLVRYEAERQDDWPKLPDISEAAAPADGTKHKILDSRLKAMAPRTSPDGLHLVYRVEGWILYALPDGLKDDAKLPAGKMPNLADRKTLDLAATRDPDIL